ncbi:MAG: polysaccharide deacetylase [Cyanobacteria bacterium P01_H01_bin.105]
MSYPWPADMRCAAVLSFDVDGESGILAANPKYAERLSALSWARYGPKVGVPRILDLLAEKDVKASFFVPGYTAEQYPALIQRIHDEGHEIGVHGYIHKKPSDLDDLEEEAALVKTCQILKEITGQKPVGYRAPWWDLKQSSPGLLARHGMQYDSSLMDDDAPYTLPTDSGDLVEIPVHWTNDDWEQFAFTVDPPTGGGVIETCEKAFQLWKEEFDGLYHYRRAFILTMHPEIIGRPARLLMLGRLIDYMQSLEGVWLTTCGAIAARHAAAQSSTQPSATQEVG